MQPCQGHTKKLPLKSTLQVSPHWLPCTRGPVNIGFVYNRLQFPSRPRHINPESYRLTKGGACRYPRGYLCGVNPPGHRRTHTLRMGRCVQYL